MKKRKEEVEGEKLSSSPWITRQCMRINGFIERYEPERAGMGIYALISDLPYEVRERVKILISPHSYAQDYSDGDPDQKQLKVLEERGLIENSEYGYTTQWKLTNGKKNLNSIYLALCRADSEPEYHSVTLEDIGKIRTAWTRIRDEIKRSGLLDDRTRTILTGRET